MIKIRKCKHDYRPHQFIRCKHDDYGNTIYVYELQCMKCGKKPFFLCHKSKNQISELYDFKNVVMGSVYTAKSRDIGVNVKKFHENTN